MYQQVVLESVAQSLVDRQDDPAELLDNLRAVKREHAETPREFQRFQLSLELDADDLEVVIGEVESEIENVGR